MNRPHSFLVKVVVALAHASVRMQHLPMVVRPMIRAMVIVS